MEISKLMLLACVLSAIPIRPGSRVPNDPSFLEPVHSSAGHVDGYIHLVSAVIIGSRSAELGMIVRPSLGRLEYSLILTKVKGPDSAAAPVTALEYAAVSKALWNLMDNYSGRQEEDILKDARVRRLCTAFPDTAAGYVRNAWTAMLACTRAPNSGLEGADGEDYEFFMGSDKRALAWSPRSGACKMLVNLGELLIKYATSDDNQRPMILQKVIDLSRRIEKAAPSGREEVEARN